MGLQESRTLGESSDTRGASIRAAWIVYFALSITISAYPTKYFFGFSAVESLQVLNVSSLFLILVPVWILAYLLIVMSDYHLSLTKDVALIAPLVITVNEVTYRMAPLGLDHDYGIVLSLVRYLAIFHHIPIPVPAQLNYLSYPGLMFLTYSFTSISNLSSAPSINYVQAALYLVAGLGVFLLARKLLKNERIALLSIPILFLLSIQTQAVILFFPWTMGITILGLALYALISKIRLVVLVVLTLGMIITHFYDPIDLVFVLGSIVVFVKSYRNPKTYGFALFSVVVFVLYFLYNASLFASGLVSGLMADINQLFSVDYALQLASTNTFAVPLWVAITRYLDLLVSSVIGVFIAVIFLVTKKGTEEGRTFGAIALGIVAFGLASFVASFYEGGPNILIGLQDVTVVSIPLMLSVASKRRALLISLLVLLLVFSGPTLVGLRYAQIATITVYPSELSAGSYFASYGQTSYSVVAGFKIGGSIGASGSFPMIDAYPNPMRNFTYFSQSYNFIDILDSRYQIHSNGYAINFSTAYNHDLVYDNGVVMILPPES